MTRTSQVFGRSSESGTGGAASHHQGCPGSASPVQCAIAVLPFSPARSDPNNQPCHLKDNLREEYKEHKSNNQTARHAKAAVMLYPARMGQVPLSETNPIRSEHSKNVREGLAAFFLQKTHPDCPKRESPWRPVSAASHYRYGAA